MHEKHRERLRERYKESGIEALADHEALELLLYFAIPRINTNPLAHCLIERFGSLQKVLEAHRQDLQKVKGIGENSALLITLVNDIQSRCAKREFGKRPRLNNIQKCGEYCMAMLQDKKYETLYLICLDAQFRVIISTALQGGTVAELPVYPRHIVETALRHNAHSVIIAHNHPGGNPHPSSSDVETTSAVLHALLPINITLLDHIITATDGYYSFSANNLIRHSKADTRKAAQAPEK